ncbi:ABC transporter permease [Allostreptomyces psammosilenae]|uniref:Peptide/nickel transport system permease protein n=1 Tax=Allostreptomyces psammosilenae TaxID=1892865 RepID=A0A852ZU84_9ACTN|nr:ABC transporter permease [Allostreptomyces psammosilenae]NYI04334.1 peptide/nickel transport system permease protein [Allostreptomyces psammosilenae]
MARYLVARLLQAVLVLWAAFTLAFAILYLLPSDPVAIMLNAGGEGSAVSPEEVARLRAEYGLQESMAGQYLSLLGGLLRGDLGTSITTGAPVADAIGQALPDTLQLVGAALGLAVVAGAGLALLATWTRARALRGLLLALPPLGVSVPTFWVGLLLLQWFSFRLPWFPAVGDGTARALLLPAITLALPTAATVAQILARSLEEVWRQPFVQVTAARGAGRTRIHLRHAVRVAAPPVLTVAGVTVGQLIVNSVVVDTVFSRNGVGRLTQTAVGAQDIPVVLGVVVFAAAVHACVNLAVDLVHPLIDPRVVATPRRAS